jgi:hypothetical protein
MPTKTTPEYTAFEELWQLASARQDDLQVGQIDEPDTDFSPAPMLKLLSSLADALVAAGAIDDERHKQMRSAIGVLEEVIQAVDPGALATALEAVNAQPLPAQ